jgi:hypothetical protein
MGSYTTTYDMYFNGYKCQQPISRKTFYLATTYLSCMLLALLAQILWLGMPLVTVITYVIVGLTVWRLAGPRYICTSLFNQDRWVCRPWIAATTWPVWAAIFLSIHIIAGIIGDEDD